jgi:hypothetical protein
MFRQSRGWCEECQRHVLIIRPQCNHLLHFFLTIATFGVWAMVWFGLSVSPPEPWRCSTCGEITRPDKDPRYSPNRKRKMV